MSYTINDTLECGTVISDRTVIEKTLVHERVVGDCFGTWITICHQDGAFHPYAVWTVVARPEGWHSEQGDYCKTLDEARVFYEQRGGK